jgi:hypothetical protein
MWNHLAHAQSECALRGLVPRAPYSVTITSAGPCNYIACVKYRKNEKIKMVHCSFFFVATCFYVFTSFCYCRHPALQFTCSRLVSHFYREHISDDASVRPCIQLLVPCKLAQTIAHLTRTRGNAGFCWHTGCPEVLHGVPQCIERKRRNRTSPSSISLLNKLFELMQSE